MGLDRPERSEVVYCEITLGPSALAARPSQKKNKKRESEWRYIYLDPFLCIKTVSLAQTPSLPPH